jgi:hypothetical protein
MDERAHAFLEQHPTAAMITLRRDGTPHVARVAVGVVEGRLWSSGTRDRLRTRFLRRNPRCTLFVFGTGQSAAQWLGLECETRIIDGPDVPEKSLVFFRMLQRGMPRQKGEDTIFWYGQEKAPAEFLQTMRDEGRILYEFEVRRCYGMY